MSSDRRAVAARPISFGRNLEETYIARTASFRNKKSQGAYSFSGSCTKHPKSVLPLCPSRSRFEIVNASDYFSSWKARLSNTTDKQRKPKRKPRRRGTLKLNSPDVISRHSGASWLRRRDATAGERRAKAMPKYYVRLVPGGPTAETGEELPNDEAAERLADAMAVDLRRGRISPYQCLVVTDEQGEVVCERPLVTH